MYVSPFGWAKLPHTKIVCNYVCWHYTGENIACVLAMRVLYRGTPSMPVHGPWPQKEGFITSLGAKTHYVFGEHIVSLSHWAQFHPLLGWTSLALSWYVQSIVTSFLSLSRFVQPRSLVNITNGGDPLKQESSLSYRSRGFRRFKADSNYGRLNHKQKYVQS